LVNIDQRNQTLKAITNIAKLSVDELRALARGQPLAIGAMTTEDAIDAESRVVEP
jgi:hypothetical protein